MLIPCAGLRYYSFTSFSVATAETLTRLPKVFASSARTWAHFDKVTLHVWTGDGTTTANIASQVIAQRTSRVTCPSLNDLSGGNYARTDPSKSKGLLSVLRWMKFSIALSCTRWHSPPRPVHVFFGIIWCSSSHKSLPRNLLAYRVSPMSEPLSFGGILSPRSLSVGRAFRNGRSSKWVHAC